MGQFLKFVFASMIGTLLVGLVLLVFLFASIAAAGGSFSLSKKPTKVEEGTILHLRLDKPIVDRGEQSEFDLDFGPFQGMGRTGLNDVLADLDKAARDERVKGILLELTTMEVGLAQAEEIRKKMLEFREKSSKPIIAYSEYYTQGTYFLASASDEVYVAPEGGLDLRGLRTELAFLKGMFDKLEIDIEFIKGSNNKYKSYGETFIEDKMTPANHEQIQAMLTSLWDTYLGAIQEQRNIDKARLNTFADSLMIRHAEDAVRLGLADGTKYKDEVIAIMKERSGLEADEELATVSLGKYSRAIVSGGDVVRGKASAKQKIAVVYAEGGISSGKSDEDVIGSETVSEAIREAREDSTIKAIVFRVNSPGGSGLASDVIWREVQLATEVKPVVVSMGDVAASGGYYISCAADKIYADPMTITGSIGVFGIIPNMQGFFNNKLGVTFDGDKTNTYADLFDLTRPLRQDERQIIQEYVDDFYEVFKQRVADGRNMSLAQVDSVGRGRVWTGVDAKRLGLVDELGGLEEAIKEAAAMVDAEEYRVVEYPESKDVFLQLLGELNAQGRSWLMDDVLGIDMNMVEHLQRAKELRRMKGIQARMPYDIAVY
ncbi:MAG: signal peptide peptidase SppA [Flavobacteriales bacterium]|nr:signal peptide peptidase SppA [Flavobacteriales bacterium]